MKAHIGVDATSGVVHTAGRDHRTRRVMQKGVTAYCCHKVETQKPRLPARTRCTAGIHRQQVALLSGSLEPDRKMGE